MIGMLLLSAGAVQAQQTGTITGRVTAASTGQPLASAQVYIAGTQLGTLTQSNGRYLIPNVPAGAHELRVTLLGYGAQMRQVTVRAGETTAALFELSARAIDLAEIVVTGTAGAARRREVGNSIATLSAQELTTAPATSIEQALTGRVAGVHVLSNSGAPGSGQTMILRGVNSITQDNAPVIYLDGVRVYGGKYAHSSGGGGLGSVHDPNQVTSALNDINPADIARIEIIKGAAATTLYGTEAAGGVIQIFTKSGTGLLADTTIWQAQITQGINTLPTMTAGSEEPSAAWFERYGPESKGLWSDQWKEPGYYQSYYLSTRGSRGDADFYVSGNWEDEEGVFPQQQAMQWGLRANLGYQAGPSLRIRFNNSLTRRNIDWRSDGNEAEGFLLNVMRGPADYTNDVDERVFQQTLTDDQTHWIAGLSLDYTPTTALNSRLVLGFDYIDQEFIGEQPFGGWFVPDGARTNRRFHHEMRTIDFRTSYRKDLTPGISTSTAVGFEVFDSQITEVMGKADGFAAPHNPTLSSGGERNVSERRLREVNAGFFVQEMVGFGDKIFLTGGIRVDGNSAFGDEFGLQTYPKLSGSYVISEYGFWPDIFDMTKLRAAYGESGKAPGYFDAEKVWRPVQAKAGETGLTPANLGNPQLGPERTREFESGLEASLFDGRLGVNFTYYYQQTLDALVPVTLDPTLGFLSPQLRNLGRIDNRGIELTLNGTAVATPDFGWDLGLAFSTNESEVVDLGDAPPVYLGDNHWVREGYPMVSYFADQVTNPSELAEPELADDQFVGPVYPTHDISLTTTLRIGDRLRFSARGQRLGGHVMESEVSLRNTQRTVWPPCFDEQLKMEAGQRDQLTALERWRCDADNVQVDAHVWPADFFRLRSVQLSYRVPENLLPGRLNAGTITVGATNLFLSTDYGGVDPEARETIDADELVRVEYYNVPPLRRFTVSFRTTF